MTLTAGECNRQKRSLEECATEELELAPHLQVPVSRVRRLEEGKRGWESAVHCEQVGIRMGPVGLARQQGAIGHAQLYAVVVVGFYYIHPRVHNA